MKTLLTRRSLGLFFAWSLAANVYADNVDQWANSVVGYSSQYSTTHWSAAQALGVPDTTSYGDINTAWTTANKNGTKEYISLGFGIPVYAYGAAVRETYGNGFVYQVDVRDAAQKLWHKVWQGTDPSKPGSPVNYQILWPQTAYMVDAVKVYVNTDANPTAWEEIDAVQLHGVTNILPALSLTAPDTLGSESFKSTGVFSITRTGDTSSPLTVKYKLSGTAINGTDYTNVTSVIIPPGQSSVGVFIKPIDDSLKEGDETVILTISSDPSNYQVTYLKQATVTIKDND